MLRRIASPALCLLAVVLAGCGSNEEPQGKSGDEAVTVTAQPVTYLPDRQRIEAIGTARAQDSAEIYPQIDGVVIAMLFEGGDYVQSGATLLRMDSRAEQLAVDLAGNAVREAEQLLGRYRRIEDTGALSESQIEQGETALVAAQIQLRQARLALADRSVRAPFSGNIGFTEVDVGDRVTTDTLIAQLDQRSVLFVDFQAPEAVYDAMQPGQTVQITPYSMPDRTFEAEVRDRNTTVSAEERSFTVRARVPNGGDMLRPGMSFRVALELSGRELPAVPEEAIVWGSDGAYLFRVADGRARRVPLTIVSRREGVALVDASLPRGANIIAQGVQKVRDGGVVRIVKAQRPAAARARMTAPKTDGETRGGADQTGTGAGAAR